MGVVKYLPADYPEINTWWAHYWGHSVPEAILPPTGFVVPGRAAGFVIFSDTPMCFLEFVVANPTISPALKAESIQLIIEAVKEACQNRHHNYVLYTMSPNKAYHKLLERAGFDKGEELTSYVTTVGIDAATFKRSATKNE